MKWISAHVSRWFRRRGESSPNAPGPTDHVIELKQALDSLVAQARQTIQSTDAPNPLLLEACDNFTSRGPELLDEATRYLWADYRSVADEFSADERRAYGIPELAPTADIWTKVSIEHPPELRTGGGLYEPGRSYISFEGEVPWEPEHGLQLVFEDGEQVYRVGPYDGHNTNAHAYADDSLLGVIFK